MQTTTALPEQDASRQPRFARRYARLGRNTGLAVLVCGALLMLILHLLLWGRAIALRGGLDAQARQTDFCATLIGALLIHDGRGNALYDLEAQRAAQDSILGTGGTKALLPYIHPPFEALLVAPLLALSPGVLYALWSLLNLVALVAALAILARGFPLPMPTQFVALVALCSFSPLLQGFALGQSTPLILLGLVGAYAALARGREGLAGLALALVVLKPQLLLVVGLLLLLQRRWRTLATCVGIVGALSLAAMPVLGPLWPLRYARFLAGIGQWAGNHNEYPQIMYNWRGLATNLLGDSAPGIFGPLVGALTLASVAVLALAWWRARGATDVAARRADDLLWALAIPIALLVAPHLYIHDLTLLTLTAWIALRLLADGAWRGLLALLWPVLLWCGYLLAFSSLFRTEEHSAWPVVPGILLMATLAGILAWGAAGVAPRLRLASRGER